MIGGALSRQATAKLVSCRINFKNGYAAEHLLVRLKEVVIVNSRAFADDPLPIRPQIRLCWMPFNAVAHGILISIGHGDNRILKVEKPDTKQRGRAQHGSREPIETDAGSLRGRNLVVLRQDGEAD